MSAYRERLYNRPRVRRMWGAYADRCASRQFDNRRAYIRIWSALARAQHEAAKRQRSIEVPPWR